MTFSFCCIDKCCKLIYKEFKGVVDERRDFLKYKKRKGGGILYDKKENSILIVQSRGKMWGLPKGTIEQDETIEECAMREIKEETGIEVNINKNSQYLSENNKRCIFYILPFEKCGVELQYNDINNDATGIGWINLKCLQKMINSRKIKLNKQSFLIINKFLLCI